MPPSASRTRTVGSASASTTARFRVSITSLDVPLGAKSPNQGAVRPKVGMMPPAAWPSAAHMNSTEGAAISCSRGGGLHFKTDTKLHSQRAEAPAFGLQSKNKQYCRLALILEFRCVDESRSAGGRRSRCDRNILLAIDLEGHRWRRET